MDHRTIIETLGGHKALAPSLGVKENAVSHWKARGIPPFYWTDIINIAAERGEQITIERLRSGCRIKKKFGKI